MKYRLKEALNKYIKLYRAKQLNQEDHSRFLHFENYLREYKLSCEEKMEIINLLAKKEQKISKLIERLEEELDKEII